MTADASGSTFAPGLLSRRERWLLAAIFAASLILIVAQSYLTPLRWGPDEPGHFIYVQSLANDWSIPRLPPQMPYRAFYQPGGGSVTHEGQQPPLYYALAGVVYRVVAGLPEDAQYRALRFFSILLGMLTLLVAWRIFRLVFPWRTDLRLGAFALTALTPMLIYLNGVVNNDALLILLFTASLYQMLRVISGRSRRRDYALLGVVVGLAMLAKATAVGLLPLVLLTGWRARGSPRAESRGSRRLAGTALAVLVALVMVSPWLAYNLVVRGRLFVYAPGEPLVQSFSEAVKFWPVVVTHCLQTVADASLFMWVPKWLLKIGPPHPALFAPAPIFAAYVWGVRLLTGALLVGLALRLLDHTHRRRLLTRLQVEALLLVGAAVVVLAAGLLRHVIFVDLVAVEGGRYLAAALPVLPAVAVIGLDGLIPRPWARAGLAALAIVALAMAALMLYGSGVQYLPMGRF